MRFSCFLSLLLFGVSGVVEAAVRGVRLQRGGNDHRALKMGGKKSKMMGMMMMISAGSSDEAEMPFPDTLLSLNSNRRPEGITCGPGETVLVGQTFWGGISSVNTKTGEVSDAIASPGFFSRAIFGLIYLQEGYIIAAGGGVALGLPSGQLHVFNYETQELVVTCSAGFFLNDLVVHNGMAIVTDSSSPQLLAFDVNELINGNCPDSPMTISLPAEGFSGDPTSFYANGIIPYSNGVFVATFSHGGVFFVPLDGGEAYNVVELGTAPFADGIEVFEDHLYVTSGANMIFVYALSSDADGIIMATSTGAITSELFDTLATSAICNGVIWSSNTSNLSQPAPDAANFVQEATVDFTFTIVGVDPNKAV